MPHEEVVLEEGEPELGYEVGGTNSDFAGLIVDGLVDEAVVSESQRRKVFKEVVKVLDSYPKTVVNGREQNYFVGTPADFSVEVAGKIEGVLGRKGLLGRIAGLLR